MKVVAIIQARVWRHAYHKQKNQAARRGIGFFLTFDEWYTIWEASGRLPERGRRKHEYVMARLGDVGPYAVGNVKIVTGFENKAEQRSPWIGRRHRDESCERISVGKLGNTNGRGNKGRVFSAEHRLKISLGKRGLL